MATKLTYDLTYDASLTDVGEMLMDPAFREEVCDAQGALRRTVTVGPGRRRHEGRHRPGADRARASRGSPGSSSATRSTSSRPSSGPTSRTATVEVVIPGKPGQMSGTIRLRESGGTTTETVDMEIKVSIPLVGGKIESLIADLLRKALKAENTVGRQLPRRLTLEIPLARDPVRRVRGAHAGRVRRGVHGARRGGVRLPRRHRPARGRCWSWWCSGSSASGLYVFTWTRMRRIDRPLALHGVRRASPARSSASSPPRGRRSSPWPIERAWNGRRLRIRLVPASDPRHADIVHASAQPDE